MDLDPDTVVIKFFWDKSQIENLKVKKVFFYWNTFFSVLQVPEHICKQWEALFRKVSGQNIILRIRIRKKFVDKNMTKSIRNHNTAVHGGQWSPYTRTGKYLSTLKRLLQFDVW
jgi:hypothetical protein